MPGAPRKRTYASAIAALVALLAARSMAQVATEPRAGVTTAFGFTGLPDALGAQCGTAVNGAGETIALDSNVGLVIRVRRPWVLQLDTRVAPQLPFPSGCSVVLPAVDTVYDSRMSRDLFETSTIRFGLETPRNLPLVRLTAGLGVLWGTPRVPVAVIGLAMSTRGPHKRFLIEAERLQTRVHADERHSAGLTGGPGYSTALRFSPSTFTVRFGIEWAFAATHAASKSP